MGNTSLAPLSALLLLVALTLAPTGITVAATPASSLAASLATLEAYVADPLAPAQEPYLSVETFPLPDVGLGPDFPARLSQMTGVAGTDLLGIRVKIGMPEGYRFESMQASLADAVFLLQDRSFLETVGHLLTRFARFLLLGQLVSVGTELEIPAHALSLLTDVTPATAEDAISLHSKREVRAKRGDLNTTDHGDYVVCRFLVAANEWSELVGIRIEARNQTRAAVVRYKIPRLKLPSPSSPPPENPPPAPAKRREVATAVEAGNLATAE